MQSINSHHFGRGGERDDTRHNTTKHNYLNISCCHSRQEGLTYFIFNIPLILSIYQHIIMYLISRHYQRLLTTVNRNCGTVSSQRTFMSPMFGSDSADSKELPSMSSSTSQISGLLSKADIVEKIAEEHELSKAKSNRIVTQIFDTIVEVSFFV